MTSEQLREIEQRHSRLSESMGLIRSCGGIHFDAEATEYVVNSLSALLSEVRRLRHVAGECECSKIGATEPLTHCAYFGNASGLTVAASEGAIHV